LGKADFHLKCFAVGLVVVAEGIGCPTPMSRYMARIANVDVTQLTGVSAANLIKPSWSAPSTASRPGARLCHDHPNFRHPNGRADMGRTVIYANRIIRTYLDLQAMKQDQRLAPPGRVQRQAHHHLSVASPSAPWDAILSNEAQVV